MFNNVDKLDQNNIEQFENEVCNVLNGINNTYDRKIVKGRPKIAFFCSCCSSHGLIRGIGFKKPQRKSQQKPREKSFYRDMRNNQNLPNRHFSSNIVNGRQLSPTSQYTITTETLTSSYSRDYKNRYYK